MSTWLPPHVSARTQLSKQQCFEQGLTGELGYLPLRAGFVRQLNLRRAAGFPRAQGSSEPQLHQLYLMRIVRVNMTRKGDRMAEGQKDCNGCCPRCHGSSSRLRGGTGTCYGGCKGTGHLPRCETQKES